MREGFTLLELLVVVVVIGILASLALVRFGNVQEKAYRATLESDLRNFIVSQALYAAEHGAFSAEPEDAGFLFSDNVFVISYELNAPAFSIEVGHSKSDITCSTSYGGNVQSVIVCEGGTGSIVDGDSPSDPEVVNAPPVAAFTMSSPSFVAGESVIFSSTSTDPESEELTYAWYFNGVLVSTSASFTHSFESGGAVSLRLVVTDPAGASGEVTDNLNVASDPAPIIVAPTNDFRPGSPPAQCTWTITNPSSIERTYDLSLEATGVVQSRFLEPAAQTRQVTLAPGQTITVITVESQAPWSMGVGSGSSTVHATESFTGTSSSATSAVEVRSGDLSQAPGGGCEWESGGLEW